MEKNVYISSVELASANKFYKLVFKVFDIHDKVEYFSTSLMSKYNAEKYETTALDLLGYTSWFGVIYGVEPPSFSLIVDSENNNSIVGLSHKKGMFLKNEVKPYSNDLYI